MKYTIEAIENAKPGMRWEEIGCHWTQGGIIMAYEIRLQGENDTTICTVPNLVNAMKELRHQFIQGLWGTDDVYEVVNVVTRDIEQLDIQDASDIFGGRIE